MDNERNLFSDSPGSSSLLKKSLKIDLLILGVSYWEETPVSFGFSQTDSHTHKQLSFSKMA
jgi:hypothetical protein